MKRLLAGLTLGLLAVGLMAPLVACAADTPANPSVKWSEDYKASLDAAKKDKKIVVLHFTGSDWCPPCKALEKTVLTSDAFAKWSADKVLVDLDYPNAKPQSADLKKQNADVAKQYNIEGYPTVILLSSDGKEIGRQVGYGNESADAFIAAREKEIAAAK